MNQHHSQHSDIQFVAELDQAIAADIDKLRANTEQKQIIEGIKRLTATRRVFIRQQKQKEPETLNAPSSNHSSMA